VKGRGEVIGGYRLITEPTNDGGGKCMWAFAEKDDRQYFLKRFLDPKRPREGSDGNAERRRLRLQECEEFERRHTSIMERLPHDIPGGGNLVLAVDFFCEGSTYYKVTERIETSSLEHPDRLDSEHKAVLLRTLALSVRLLHDINVVHGDLKPGNVLVQKRRGSPFHVAKLIDFDDSYLSGMPPERDVIGGDPVCGAPEWRRYIQHDKDVQPEHLTTAADMFAVGLLTHYYLTGSLPGHDKRYDFAADAVNAGAGLRIDGRLSPAMRELVQAMTARSPGARPKITAFIDALKVPGICVLDNAEPMTISPQVTTVVPAGAVASPTTSRVRFNLNGSVPETPSAPPRTGPLGVSRVRINLKRPKT
jgi:serine/threonine protein kinase